MAIAVVQFPEEYQKPEALADWLELTALCAADRNASTGDAERELDRLNYGNRESLLGNVMTEFDRRARATGPAGYPFQRGHTSIQLKGSASDYPAYFFCLALSYFGWKIRKGAPENPWLLFEELSFFSAKNYLGGKAILFGTSARTGTKGKNVFRRNIEALVKALGEGECFTSTKTLASKDSKLDLVAWKAFDDQRPSQVIIFGQCKAGKDWKDALNELDPDAFWDQWMSGGKGKVSRLLRSVFVPHRIFDDKEWDLRARRARLLFDRCRIVNHSHSDTASGAFAARLLKCCKVEWELPI
jgi:hypothetical protein